MTSLNFDPELGREGGASNSIGIQLPASRTSLSTDTPAGNPKPAISFSISAIASRFSMVTVIVLLPKISAGGGRFFDLVAFAGG